MAPTSILVSVSGLSTPRPVARTAGESRRQYFPTRRHRSEGLNSAVAGRWSSDGSEILLRTNRNGNDDIAAVPEEGGPVRMIVDSPLDESINDVSRDGANLVYFAIPPSNQIVREPSARGPREVAR